MGLLQPVCDVKEALILLCMWGCISLYKMERYKSVEVGSMKSHSIQCRPMINKPPPFKGLNIRIPIIIPVKRRGFINHGFTLGTICLGLI